MKRTTVSERALVLAPRGRDAAIAAAMLGEAGISAHSCGSLSDLIRQLDQGAALVVVTEEALVTANLAPLAAWLADQEEWSDLPFMLLTSHGGGFERNPAAQRYLDVLGNVTFLERPFHPTTLVSLARSALRARRRQYEARARLEALRESEARLRAAVDAVQRANETLEARVAGRTVELTEAHDALRQAQKMEAVGQLTGGIAHDFNNLLTGITGSLDIVQRRIAAGRTVEAERFISAAVTSANRAAALTHRLLAFSRRQPLDPRPVDANQLVTSLDELLRRTLGESIAMEIVTADGLWPTRCDPHQLESAILNLAINARDAMPEGGKLTIETNNTQLDSAYAARAREVEPGQYVCICVSDTGSGMSKDILERVFEPFFTTKPIGQGTGLGLSMVYGFARQSDGHAKVYSEVGQGTTVKIYLPRYCGVADASESPEQTEHMPMPSQAGEVVLVVEDETAVRDLVVEVLNELGYRALQAVDGPSGLETLKRNDRIDLLVTDVGLPGLNGRQLADAARQARPGLKVLFMTGYAKNAATSAGFLEPGMEMITKPFAIDALAQRIRDMIGAELNGQGLATAG